MYIYINCSQIKVILVKWNLGLKPCFLDFTKIKAF